MCSASSAMRGCVTGRAIGVGKYRHTGDAHLAQRADHAHGDLAAVGNQDLGKHAARIVTSGHGGDEKPAAAKNCGGAPSGSEIAYTLKNPWSPACIKPF